MQSQYFDHHVSYITTAIKNRDCSVVGTGFFYRVDFETEKRSKILLISNKHVLKATQYNPYITLNCKTDNDTPDFGNTITFSGFENLCVIHPDIKVDLGCVDVSKITHENVYSKFLHSQLLREIDYSRIAQGNEVKFIGYPLGYYDNINNLPLLRRGVIASVPEVDFQGESKIIIDAPVYEGSSGSPVFVDWDNKYTLLGVISDTMKSEIAHGIHETIGLGVVIKQRNVIDLINYFKAYVLESIELTNQHIPVSSS